MACADPECFFQRWSNFDNVFFSWWVDPNSTFFGPSSARQRNAMRANDGPLWNAGLAALWFFTGFGSVLLYFVIFQGGGGGRTRAPPSVSAHAWYNFNISKWWFDTWFILHEYKCKFWLSLDYTIGYPARFCWSVLTSTNHDFSCDAEHVLYYRERSLCLKQGSSHFYAGMSSSSHQDYPWPLNIYRMSYKSQSKYAYLFTCTEGSCTYFGLVAGTTKPITKVH